LPVHMPIQDQQAEKAGQVEEIKARSGHDGISLRIL